MKKSSIVAIVLVAVVALAAVLVWAQQDSEQEPATNSPATNQEELTDSGDTEAETGETHVITYDESGFSPSTLTVSQGDTVTFRNESTTPIGPASNEHPVHTDLPGFDSLEPLEQGEEYSFTFEEKGEWGFHNHLDSSQTGTIIVQ